MAVDYKQIPKTRQTLARIGSKVVEQAKRQIRNAPTRKNSPYHGPHVASGALLKDFGMEVEDLPTGGIRLIVTGPDYLEELDEGQSGRGIKYPTQFTFDATVREIRTWLQQKNWKPKSVGSRRYSDTLESYAKALHRRLQFTGIKPTKFLSKPLKRNLTQVAYNEVTRSYADDAVTLTLSELDAAGYKK